jgi:hypothetical protein
VAACGQRSDASDLSTRTRTMRSTPTSSIAIPNGLLANRR